MAAISEPSKLGNVRWQDFEVEAYLAKLDPIVAALKLTHPAANYDRRSLGQLYGQLEQLMEDALGVKAFPPKPFPKVPAKLLRNFAPRGPLYTIAATIADVRRARDLKKFDLLAPEFRRQNLEVLAAVRVALQQAGWLKHPRVHVHASNGPASPKLTALVTKLGGELMPYAGSPDVTHVLYPFGVRGDTDDGKCYMRSLEKREQDVRVHWWYRPDSYDEFVAASVAPLELDDEKPSTKGPWKLYSRWLVDSDKYNEWMNEIDYETDDAAAEQDAILGVKRKVEGVAEHPDAKRGRIDALKAAARPAPPPELAGWGEQLGGGVERRTVVNPFPRAVSGVATVIDISHGQHLHTGEVRLSRPAQPQEADSKEMAVNGDTAEPSVAGRQCSAPHLVAAHAAWFDGARIADVERSSLPEFFDGRSPQKTPEAYRAARNAIVELYQKDVSKRLRFAHCRGWLQGDVNAGLRVFCFLEHWGVINAQADAHVGAKHPSFIVPDAATGQSDAMQLLAGANAPSVEALYRFQSPTATDASVAPLTGAPNSSSLLPRTDLSRHILTAAAPSVAHYKCSAMPWVVCTAVQYQCTKQPDVSLCPEAFADGHFPTGTSAKDFVRLGPASEQRATETMDGWTDAETLLLLEAVALYGEKWQAVGAYVGSKNQLQCVTRFLALPIDEALIHGLERPNLQPIRILPRSDASSEGLSGANPAEVQGSVPFPDAGNPLMAQLAFLTTMLSPGIAAAAAQRALEVLSNADGDGHDGADGEPPPEQLWPASQLQEAAAAALSAGACKAKSMADAEERDIQRTVAEIIELQLQKVQIKLSQHQAMEDGLKKEQAAWERERRAVLGARGM